MDGSVLETGYRLLVCITGALIAVLLVRLPLRHAFGSRIAYWIWLLVPIVMIGLMAGSLAPMRELAPLVPPIRMSQVRLPWPLLPAAPSSSGQIHWVILGWTLGAVLFALLQWWQQHTFVRRLGVLRLMPNGAWMSERADIGPAVVGVFPPRMVLPADFHQRFTAPEQIFALAHESMHIARRDPLANLLVAIVRSLFWFHPLVHIAVRYFRTDQELACDADVLGAHTAHTQNRHHYASAILKGQLSSPALPTGCHLESDTAVSLKRRLLMLQTPLPRRGRRMLGIGALSVVAFATFLAACATEAPVSGSSDPVVTANNQQRRQNLGNVISADSVPRTAPLHSIADLLGNRVPGLTLRRTSGTPADSANQSK